MRKIFFSPWDHFNFVTHVLTELKDGREVRAANDITMAATYVPDPVHTCLNLLLDGEEVIFHIANEGAVSLATLARKAAVMAGYDLSQIRGVASSRLSFAATRPKYSVLKSEKGIRLPHLEDALRRCLEACADSLSSQSIAVQF